MKDEKEITSDEIRKEFQLERMVLFTDAVFAIVITLMAIEIKAPENHGDIKTETDLLHQLRHLAPVILAYAISFSFVGVVWYRHLSMFSKLKDYDTGLVVRNLFLLFFIGMLPFAASLFAQFKAMVTSYVIYISVVFLTLLCQQLLQYYIIVQRPNLRRNVSVVKETQQLKVVWVSLSGLFLMLVSVGFSPLYLRNPDDRQFIIAIGFIVVGLATRLSKSFFMKKR